MANYDDDEDETKPIEEMSLAEIYDLARALYGGDTKPLMFDGTDSRINALLEQQKRKQQEKR